VAVGHGNGLFGKQITGGGFPFPFPFPFWHRKGLRLPLLHGWGLGLGSGGTRFHVLPKLAGRAGHDWTGRLLKFFMK
jgi:hypothetical protein